MFLFYLTKKNDLEEEIIHLFHEVSIFTFDFKLSEVTQSDGATSNKSKSLSSIYFIHQEDSCTLLRTFTAINANFKTVTHNYFHNFSADIYLFKK